MRPLLVVLVAAVAAGALLAPRGRALDGRSCSFQAWNHSVEALSFQSGSAFPFSGQIGSSTAAAELENLPLIPHPGGVTVSDDIPAPPPGGVTSGASYVFVNPIEGACGATVTWKGSDVEKNSSVADTATLAVSDPPIGSNTFSCTTTGSLDCAAVALENDHDLMVIADVSSRTVYDCTFKVTNGTGSDLTGDEVNDPTFSESIPTGTSGSNHFSFDYDGCSGDYVYDYVTGQSTTCAPPRVPVYPRCQTVTSYAYVEVTFRNDGSGLSASCAPKDSSMPIACTVTFDSQSEHVLTFTVDVTTGRAAQSTVSRGTPGRDRFVGTARNDVVHGSGGDDLARGGEGDDLLSGGAGHDTIGGGSGDDVLVGNAGEDTILAGKGADVVHAGSGNDRVWARDGERDVIDCGGGRDYLVADRFDEWRHCESVDVTGRPLPPRRADVVRPADLPGTRWRAAGEPPRVRRFVSRLTGGECLRAGLPELAWDGSSSFARLGHGLAYVAVSAATYRTPARATRAARHLTPRVLSGCLRNAHWTPRPGGGKRLASGGSTLDVVRAVRGRSVVLFAFFASSPADPLPSERAIVAAALRRSA